MWKKVTPQDMAEILIPVQVLTHEDKPSLDDTYFRTSDVIPFISDGKLYVYDFRGSHRSWGSPRCTSTVDMLAEDVIVVLVTGWHKHTVSSVGGTYYFVNEGGEWIRRRANAKRVRAAWRTETESGSPRLRQCGGHHGQPGPYPARGVR